MLLSHWSLWRISIRKMILKSLEASRVGTQYHRYQLRAACYYCLLGLGRIVEFSSSGREGMWRACSVLVRWRWRCCLPPVGVSYPYSLLPIECLYLNQVRIMEGVGDCSWLLHVNIQFWIRAAEAIKKTKLFCTELLSHFQWVKLKLTDEMPTYRTPRLTKVWRYFRRARIRDGGSAMI